jgi:hypothetical protein
MTIKNIENLTEAGAEEAAPDYGRNDQHDTEVSDRKDKIRFEDGDLGLERMADAVHQVWCMWMEYQFSLGLVLRDKGFKINPKEHGRWRRQTMTSYAELSEEEKQSARDIARRYLNIAWLPDKINEGRRELIEENNV